MNSMSAKPRFFCFSHIPKTAGTTFNSILDRNFHGKLHRTSHGFYEAKLTKDQISWALNRGKTHLHCLAGHAVSADLPYDHPDYHVIGITIVREPVDRLISEYFYLRKLGVKNIIQKEWPEFLKEISESGPNFFWDTQVRFLGVGLDELKQRIKEGKLVVIPQSRFDEGLIMLQDKYEEFRDVSYVSRNINPARKATLDCPDWFQAKCMSRDIELFRFASNFFDKEIETTFGGALRKAVDLHKARCFQRKVFKEPFRKVSAKMNSMLSRW
jgi:hypothetical protein